MILVLLGTQDKSFSRLLAEVDRQIGNGTIREKVVVQAGHTAYASENMEIFSFIPKEQMESLILEARIVITHAGVGSILECLRLGKKTIAAARLRAFREHTNDHQLEILKVFGDQGCILALNQVSDLHEALLKAESFEVPPFVSNQSRFLAGLEKHIDSLLGL